MNTRLNKWVGPLAAAALALALSGCGSSFSVFGDDGIIKDRGADYKQARTESSLEIPPDLSSSSIDDAMVVPDINPRSTATYSQYAAERSGPRAVQTQTAVLPENPDIRVMRDADRRWLVVNAAPEAVWPRIREFWLQAGFLLKIDDPQTGILETDWAENRADIPKGFIRDMLGKVFEQLYSSATRDKFRVRLERGQRDGTTEIYLTHFGVEEVVTGGATPASETGTVWKRRPREPELEAEMLNRLMVYLGTEERQARALLAANQGQADQAQRPRATLSRGADGLAVLAMEDDFSRAWRRVGIALDRTGFTVDDRDRSRGIYYVRYNDPLADTKKKEGLLSKLAFWQDDDETGTKGTSYLVRLVTGDGAGTRVVVLDEAGQPERSDTAYRILSLLEEQLK